MPGSRVDISRDRNRRRVTGSSRDSSTPRVPSDSVYNPFSVRSMRAERTRVEDSRLTPTRMTSANAKVPTVAIAALLFMVASLLPALVEFDQKDVRIQEERQDRDEEHDIAQVDHALPDGLEVGQETHRGDRGDHGLGQPGA